MQKNGKMALLLLTFAFVGKLAAAVILSCVADQITNNIAHKWKQYILTKLQ